MPRGACTFKQQDVTRTLRAFVAAGIEVKRCEIEKDGRIILVAGRTEIQGPPEQEKNDWLDAR